MTKHGLVKRPFSNQFRITRPDGIFTSFIVAKQRVVAIQLEVPRDSPKFPAAP